jgi:hypothetical protein
MSPAQKETFDRRMTVMSHLAAGHGLRKAWEAGGYIEREAATNRPRRTDITGVPLSDNDDEGHIPAVD